MSSRQQLSNDRNHSQFITQFYYKDEPAERSKIPKTVAGLSVPAKI